MVVKRSQEFKEVCFTFMERKLNAELRFVRCLLENQSQHGSVILKQ